MAGNLKEHIELRQSLAVAVEVQRSLLPAADPAAAGLDIAGRSKYCDAAGGDYFDFIDVANPRERAILIAVGDVMGHGISAALLMASARAALRAQATGSGDLARVMTKALVAARPEEEIGSALQKMQSLGCRHLPVVDEGNLIGMLSLRDLLKIDDDNNRARASFLSELVTYSPDYDS